MDFEDDFENPFRSPTPEPNRNNKRPRPDGEPQGLGIDEEVEVQKRARQPRIKLDEGRLLSEKGIPKLRRKARDLKLKGKGHEFSDAARLLSFYQTWLDDLFPKAKFLDALAMVEKAGHKTSMHKMRMDWINEGKPKTSVDNDGDGEENPQAESREPNRIAPVFEKGAQNRTGTPTGVADDLFGDDIYGATPRKAAADKPNGDVPDDEDLDALMAEMDSAAGPGKPAQSLATRPFPSIFGGGNGPKNFAEPAGAPDDEDLDALLAEAEAEADPSQHQNTGGSIFGSGKTKGLAQQQPSNEHDDTDDLDALLAEAEAETQSKAQAKPAEKPPPPAQQDGVDADEEEAMAEMDGLW